jgi:hypothetical protein
MTDNRFYDPLTAPLPDRDYYERLLRRDFGRISEPISEPRKATPKRKKRSQKVSQTKRLRIPKGISTALAEIRKDPIMNDGIREMDARKEEFSSPMAAALAGIAANPVARRHFDTRLDAMWRRTEAQFGRFERRVFPEVVVGAGLHAAIYCAVRAAQGCPKPIVIEAGSKVGGIFAVSSKPSFYLNSRNRPGALSIPGQPGALNVLPAAVAQPADLSADEYQRNSDLALIIRATLAMHATVLTGVKISGLGLSSALKIRLLGPDAKSFCEAKRVILATGLGNPMEIVSGASSRGRIYNYPTFMRRMDEPFPFKDIRRVAVIGAGDSGRTVIEALTGQGPSSGMSVASLDWVERIDWYGLDQQYVRKTWEECNRSRYRGIGRALPQDGQDALARVRPIVPRATSINEGFNCVYVNEVPYDLAINCTGFLTNVVGNDGGYAPDLYTVNGRAVGNWLNGRDVFAVGPAASLAFTPDESTYLADALKIKENSTSIFRYAGRTAALAAFLT